MPTTETIENEAIASFSDGADNVPVSELIVNITATQAGSGTPSPSNPRAISGHSSCTITVEDDIDNPQEVYTVTISLGDTYYGCTLNVTTGELTVTHGYADLGGLNYTKDTTTVPGKTLFLTPQLPNAKIYFNAICSHYPFVGNYTNLVDKSCSYIYGVKLAIYDTDFDSYTEAQVKDAMAGAQLVYKLATPTTVQLTPTEVRTLLDDNNIYADTGDINKLVYFKTGCEAIARLIEAYT